MIERKDLELRHASSNEPDMIGIEIFSRSGDLLFDMYLQENGRRSVVFGQVDGKEFAAADLCKLISDCSEELDEWAANLRKPGEIWSQRNGDRE